jgi:hypothetical protein
MWIEKRPCHFTNEELIDSWIKMHIEFWFNNKENGFYNYTDMARGIAEYWLKNRKHGPDYNDGRIVKLQMYWDEYIDMFNEQA